MIPHLRLFHPAQDTELTVLPPAREAEGPSPDIDTTLYHSQERGFYLVSRIAQIRRGRVWKTATAGGEALSVARHRRRRLTTVRPLTRAEAIRILLESHLPEEEGVSEEVLGALSSAGIIPEATPRKNRPSRGPSLRSSS